MNVPLSAFAITGLYAEKRVTQVCIIQTVLSKDDPATHSVAGDVAICSSTRVAADQVLTAGHCMIEPKQTTVTCSCGESDRQKSVEYAVETKGGLHPDFVEADRSLVRVDARLVTLGQKNRNDCTGAGVAPMPVVKSGDVAKKLLATGRCYLAGWGLDNGQSSALHAVLTPRGNQIDSYAIENSKFSNNSSSVDLITFYNDAYRSRMSAEQDRVKQNLADSGAPTAHVNQLGQDQLKEYDRMMTFISGDRNRHNSIRQGDSGGALFCTDDSGVDQLLGVIHSEWQEVVLTSSPLISQWLNKNGISN